MSESVSYEQSRSRSPRDEWRLESGAWLLCDPPAPSPGPYLRVVALGGGTGLPVVLRGLKAHLYPSAPSSDRSNDRGRLTAIVTVADDGGSSGRLRYEHGVLPPGDVRNCLLALADGDTLMASLFDFRFHGNGETGGHSLGNLILTALARIGSNSFDHAVEQGGRLLTIRGDVFPSTLEDVTLRAEFTDGTIVAGESKIPQVGLPIRRVMLEPREARAVPRALQALAAADLVVIGPGSLYTSIIPSLLVAEVAETIAASQARVVYVMNLMTEPGETDGYTAAEHVMAIRRHVPSLPIHDLLYNTDELPAELLVRYAEAGSVPVTLGDVARVGCHPTGHPLLLGGHKVRHNPLLLGRALLELVRG